MVLVVGLDSGATKSVCAIADEAGRVLGVGSSGGGNYHVVGVKAARDNVLEAVEEARAQARIEETFDVGCFGMGGLDSKHDYETISGFLRPLNLARRYVIVNDVVIAYYAVTAGERPGAVVVGGTGSIAYGMNEMGDEARSGGWGWIMGDEGSALDISRRALMAAAKAYDGRGPGTVLVELFERHFGVDRYEDVIPLIYTRGVGPADIASLAPIVTVAAEKGDPVAIGILEEAGRELGEAIVAVARRLGIRGERVIVGASGSVFRAGSFVWEPLKRTVRALLPNAVFREPIFAPVIGAIILGLREGGVAITDELVDRLRSSFHERSRARSTKNNSAHPHGMSAS